MLREAREILVLIQNLRKQEMNIQKLLGEVVVHYSERAQVYPFLRKSLKSKIRTMLSNENLIRF